MHRFHPTPDSLHSEETGLPFAKCGDCGVDLADSHLIQKAYFKGEVIMEIAICESCQGELRMEFSTESRDRIGEYFLDHSDVPQRLADFRSQPVGAIGPWIARCFTCGADRENCAEYTIAAHCMGTSLVYGETPLMMCGACMETMMKLMSSESLGTYERWLERCLPMAPANPVDSPRAPVLV